ncbi:MAG: protein-glutamine glutaminase family protein [Bdellovibrionia bacterium]
MDLSTLTSINPAFPSCAALVQTMESVSSDNSGSQSGFVDKCMATNSDQPPPESALRRSIPEAELNKLFAKLAKSEQIGFERPENANCHARAHLMAKFFEQHGIYSQKYFLYQKEIPVPNPFVVGQVMAWVSHVAVVVRVQKNDGSEEDRIIDPATFTRPVKIDNWTRMLTKDQCTELSALNKDDPYCHVRRLERFSYMGRSFEPQITSWKTDDIKTSCEAMYEDIAISLNRRSIGAGVASPDGSGRIVASGACLFVPYSNTRDEIHHNVWHTVYPHSTCENADESQ